MLDHEDQGTMQMIEIEPNEPTVPRPDDGAIL